MNSKKQPGSDSPMSVGIGRSENFLIRDTRCGLADDASMYG